MSLPVANSSVWPSPAAAFTPQLLPSWLSKRHGGPLLCQVTLLPPLDRLHLLLHFAFAQPGRLYRGHERNRQRGQPGAERRERGRCCGKRQFRRPSSPRPSNCVTRACIPGPFPCDPCRATGVGRQPAATAHQIVQRGANPCPGLAFSRKTTASRTSFWWPVVSSFRFRSVSCNSLLMSFAAFSSSTSLVLSASRLPKANVVSFSKEAASRKPRARSVWPVSNGEPFHLVEILRLLGDDFLLLFVHSQLVGGLPSSLPGRGLLPAAPRQRRGCERPARISRASPASA